MCKMGDCIIYMDLWRTGILFQNSFDEEENTL